MVCLSLNIGEGPDWVNKRQFTSSWLLGGTTATSGLLCITIKWRAALPWAITIARMALSTIQKESPEPCELLLLGAEPAPHLHRIFGSASMAHFSCAIIDAYPRLWSIISGACAAIYQS
jgi:hypothetical protein